ncbi:MAG: DNA polymerase III subunit beta [bacterium]|nr:DNA polymerase III subunit beta [bacterium]
MNIVIKKYLLLESLQLSIISQKSLIPILSNVLLEAGHNILTITSTDLDISVKCRIEADVIEEGSVTLPFKKLLDIIREIPEEDITIKEKDNFHVSITSGKSFFNIAGLNPNDYPIIADISGDRCFSILSSIFKKMIKKMAFAAAIEDPRRVLNGGCLNAKGTEITITATDGFVLSSAKYKMSENVSKDVRVVIPNKTLSEFMRLLRDEAMVDVYLGNNQIMLIFNDIVVTSRLIDGSFPDYESFIPNITRDNVLHIKNSVLLNTCKRVSIMVSEDVNVFNFSIINNIIQIASFTPGLGEAKENIIDIDYKGEDFSVVYNSKHMINVLRNIDIEEIDILFISKAMAGVIDIKDDNEEYFYFIIPTVEDNK